MSAILHAFAAGRGRRLSRVSRGGGGWSVDGAPGNPRPRTFVVNTAGLLAYGSLRIRLAFPVVSHQWRCCTNHTRRLQLRSQLRNCRPRRRTGFPLSPGQSAGDRETLYVAPILRRCQFREPSGAFIVPRLTLRFGREAHIMNRDSAGPPERPDSGRRLPEPMSSVLASLPPAPSPGAVVDALVPACADLAWIAVPVDRCLWVCAYAHIDPLRLSALAEFQQSYAPSIDDPQSFMARVFRTGTPELVRPEALIEVERRVSNAGTRAALTALGARTSLMAPIIDPRPRSRARGVLITAMSSSGRMVDDDDLADLVAFARMLSPRFHW